MKRYVLLVAISMLVMCQAIARQGTPSIIIPGKAHIDVEKLNRRIDFKMNVNNLSLYEIRVLRAAVEARKGEIIMESEIRRLFDATTWYEKAVLKRAGVKDVFSFMDVDIDKIPPITYTSQEKAFLKKLDEAEERLLANNIVLGGTRSNPRRCPNLANLANPMQIESMTAELKNALSTNGFGIVPGNVDQLFQVYENNDYHEFPSFVTTDLYLHTFHMYFDYMLRTMEEERMLPLMSSFTQQLYDTMTKKAAASSGEMKEAAMRNAAFFAIAHSLFTGEQLAPLPEAYKGMAQDEVDNVKKAQNEFSQYFDYTITPFMYDIYRPRGHYTRNEALKRYFMGMMWMQNAPFASNKPGQLKAALLIANEVGGNSSYKQTYKNIDEPIAFLMGNPDNLSLLQIYDIMCDDGDEIEDYMDNDDDFNRIRAAIEKKDDEQTRIRPKFERESHCRINFMPQRYMPDAEVLQEMVDYDSRVTKRDVPKGLDVLAAMGVESALKVLVDELKEQQRWDKYMENMKRMQQLMGGVDWTSSIACMWIESLQALSTRPTGTELPYFMNTHQWDKKNLNTALASWTELKHDAILYAKQPMGAECGGGELPKPYVSGYVEPNVAYWTKAIALLDATSSVLKDNNMLTSEMASLTTELREEAEFLLDMSKKELNGEQIEIEEYEHIKVIGSTFEYLTLQIVGTEDPSAGWDATVSGADKNVALIADVYTANADNNSNKSVLYEAVGPVQEIYVVVEIEGYLYLTRGAVFSYREFQEDIAAPRITDEEWQQDLKSSPNKGIPSWMKELLVPLSGKPIDNEHYFYSTGC